MKRARAKELGIEENEGAKELPTYPLVNIPDSSLDEEGIKEKRRQRLMKAGYDARIRAKAEREEERVRLEEESRLDDEERKTDPVGWLKGLRKQHEVSIDRSLRGFPCSFIYVPPPSSLQSAMIKIKDRKKKKEQLGDRKSLAAQQRMKSIATLASEVKVGKKRKRGEAGMSCWG